MTVMGFFNKSGKTEKTTRDNLEKTLSAILVKDIMSKKLITASPSTTAHQISKMMEQGIGSVLVKNGSDNMGIITDRDFAIKIVANKHSYDIPIDKIASFPLQTINSNESVLDAAKQMATKKIRKLAVVENDKVVGIVTSSDLIRQLSKITQ